MQRECIKGNFNYDREAIANYNNLNKYRFIEKGIEIYEDFYSVFDKNYKETELSFFLKYILPPF